MRQIIAVDLDSVLAYNIQILIDYSNQRWGMNLTPDDYNDYWGHMWGVDKEEVVKRYIEVREKSNFFNSEPIKEAKGVLEKLTKRYELIVVTSRGTDVAERTYRWVDEHFAGIFTEVKILGVWDDLDDDPHLKTKAGICEVIGVDYLIDDEPKHINAVAKCGTKGLLFGNYSW
ncbi:hypothetical protein FWD20_03170, partial [Candidatus Saccharibacteria bacterium]|nr:hypothetical protein [Candidatus Saccharibacteria bacterium]